ncbi:MAG: FtsX-like permease family protein, partial [Lachnospiraceae bacterium]|nr:FtsX-like permease family protein [Lachnospiraceae bacterium]
MMNVVSTLTLRHLQVNKKRTVVTILGIAAATALITTMLTGVASFFAFFGTIAYHEMGHWDASLKNLSAEQIRELKADARIANVAVLDKTLDITGIRAESDVSQRLQLGNITHMDRQRIENRVTCSYDGALPSNEKEVAVEEKFLKDNDLDLQVGDPITLEVGNRYILEADGSRSTLGGPYRTDEAFESLYRETYTVTAIFHDNAPTEGFDVVHCMAEGYLPAENQVDICLKKVDMRALKVLEEIARDHNLTYEGWNSEYLISVFAIHWDGNGISAILPLGLVCLLIILATAVILIYNAFGMSLAERMRYLGMLASVGASRRQKRGSVYFEAFILGIFGIPLGILLGYLGAYFTLAVLGKQMVEANMIAGAKGFVDHIPVKIPLPALVFIVGISALTIFISALIPALKASRVMPIEALRQTNVIKVSRRRLRINPLIRKIFGYEGELAYKNIKRNGIKGSVITVSIAVSVAMFLVITHYCDSIQKLNNLDWSLPYQINAGCALDQQEMLEQILDEMPEVEDYYVSHFLEYHFRELPNQPDVIPAKSDALKAEYRKKDYQENFSETGMLLCSIPDEDFNRLLEANGIDPAPFYEDGELQAVLLNDYIR